MLVFSTKFLFLGLYISVTSGSPTAVTPNLPSILEPRRPPSPTLCIGQQQWQSRQCDSSRGPGVWFDTCKMVAMGQEHTFTFYSNCADAQEEHEVCEDIIDDEGDKHIQCIFFDDLIKRKKLSNGSLVGISDQRVATVSRGATQVMASVNIDERMGASVAAVLLSKDMTFAIKAQNVIVGHVHGSSTEICKGDKSRPERASVCYPTGRWRLKKGDVIDFTWGMTNLQIGVLAYTIWKTA